MAAFLFGERQSTYYTSTNVKNRISLRTISSLTICYLHGMSLDQVWQEFVTGMQQTSWLEYIAVFAGIGSVWFSRIENIWVYPIGLISTIIYVYLSFKFHLVGEASVNIYYSVLSIYGWVLWARKDQHQQHVLHITYLSKKEWLLHLAFFIGIYLVIYF